MADLEPKPLDEDSIDWSLTTWEGARREQLRRWAKLPLEHLILAVEEMQSIAECFGAKRPGHPE